MWLLRFAKHEHSIVDVMDHQIASGQGVVLGGEFVFLLESGKVSEDRGRESSDRKVGKRDKLYAGPDFERLCLSSFFPPSLFFFVTEYRM